MAPAQRACQRRRDPIGAEKRIVSGIGVGLENTCPAAQMANGMFAAPVTEKMEDRRRWSWSAKWLIVTDISPDPARIGFGLRQNRDRRVVAMQSLGGQDMRFDEAVERHQRRGAGSDLIGQGRKAELDTVAGIAIALAAERLVRSGLLEQ